MKTSIKRLSIDVEHGRLCFLWYEPTDRGVPGSLKAWFEIEPRRLFRKYNSLHGTPWRSKTCPARTDWGFGLHVLGPFVVCRYYIGVHK